MGSRLEAIECRLLDTVFSFGRVVSVSYFVVISSDPATGDMSVRFRLGAFPMLLLLSRDPGGRVVVLFKFTLGHDYVRT